MIVVWDYKYKWDTARPNQYDHEMKTEICTPRFPSYPSGHASMSGCSEVVLSYFFPREAKKLRKFAEEDAVSRLYAGVHFPIDNTEGLKLGRYIGKVVVDHLKTQRYSNRTPIDTPYKEYRNANFFADDFKQFIPFDFADDCSSLVKEKDKEREKYSYEDNDKFKDNTNKDSNVYSDKEVYIDKDKDKDKFKDIERSIDSNKHNDKAESSSHQNRRRPRPFIDF